jgi:hypothetical protein
MIEMMARTMHDAYERAALRNGWETQERSRVPWEDLPAVNRQTMLDALSEAVDATVAEGLIMLAPENPSITDVATVLDGILLSKMVDAIKSYSHEVGGTVRDVVATRPDDDHGPCTAESPCTSFNELHVRLIGECWYVEGGETKVRRDDNPRR